MTMRPRPPRRGLSLIEVVLAIVLLGLAVPTLLVQIGAGARQQAASAIQQNLIQLASERLGEIYADHANPTCGYGYIVASAYPAESAPGGRAGYGRQTEVREVSPADHTTPTPGSGIKRVRITVTGPDSGPLTLEGIVTSIPGALAPATQPGNGNGNQ
ncbi:MAG: prepilin-type N-terminal cleavage/methylation domain-containing protein, partial [Planctomycetota bacterium]